MTAQKNESVESGEYVSKKNTFFLMIFYLFNVNFLKQKC